MEPYLSYSYIDALADDLRCDVWVCCDHDGLNRLSDRAQIRIRRPALQLWGIWIDREDFVPGSFQLSVNVICRLLGVARNAGDRDGSRAQKLGYLRRQL